MQYVIVGIGGQGILFSSRVLGHIALSKGERVVGSEVHGMAQRGGSVISHFKVGDYNSPMVKAKEADVLLAFDQNEAVRNLHFLKQGGQVVVNTHEASFVDNPSLKSWLGERDAKLRTILGYDILKKHMGGRFLFLNVLILGAMCGAGVGSVSIDEVREAVRTLAPARFVEDNIRAVDLGYEGTR
ncbi:MAG: 2-oxoacid:acceptor oxidoreductase family protein [Thermovirgaceae bacterium]|nr:2-oxoacid:acceptor oxidoreductase family protein [Thermovirgaceae bacterium]